MCRFRFNLGQDLPDPDPGRYKEMQPIPGSIVVTSTITSCRRWECVVEPAGMRRVWDDGTTTPSKASASKEFDTHPPGSR